MRDVTQHLQNCHTLCMLLQVKAELALAAVPHTSMLLYLQPDSLAGHPPHMLYMLGAT